MTVRLTIEVSKWLPTREISQHRTLKCTSSSYSKLKGFSNAHGETPVILQSGPRNPKSKVLQSSKRGPCEKEVGIDVSSYAAAPTIDPQLGLLAYAIV